MYQNRSKLHNVAPATSGLDRLMLRSERLIVVCVRFLRVRRWVWRGWVHLIKIQRARVSVSRRLSDLRFCQCLLRLVTRISPKPQFWFRLTAGRGWLAAGGTRSLGQRITAWAWKRNLQAIRVSLWCAQLPDHHVREVISIGSWGRAVCSSRRDF